MEPVLVTEAGLAALNAELAALEGDGRRAIAAQIKTAREWGDLKENGEYHAAKEAQAHLETQIAVLRERIHHAEVVEAAEGDVVGLGSTVEVEDEESGKRRTHRLVSSHEASTADGTLSVESPVGVALLGRQPGDVAVASLPRGERRFKVLSVG